eukprot:scaffold12092_cov22-Attheya_sp.AAC.1
MRTATPSAFGLETTCLKRTPHNNHNKFVGAFSFRSLQEPTVTPTKTCGRAWAHPLFYSQITLVLNDEAKDRSCAKNPNSGRARNHLNNRLRKEQSNRGRQRPFRITSRFQVKIRIS